MRRIIQLLEADELDPDAVTKVSSTLGRFPSLPIRCIPTLFSFSVTECCIILLGFFSGGNAVTIENGSFAWDAEDGREDTLTGSVFNNYKSKSATTESLVLQMKRPR